MGGQPDFMGCCCNRFSAPDARQTSIHVKLLHRNIRERPSVIIMIKKILFTLAGLLLLIGALAGVKLSAI